jgi:hypothetical protein
MAQFPLLPLLIPLCLPFVSPSTYLAPSSCDRNRPPPSQVACKLTLFAPPFPQLSHPFQFPTTPTAPRLAMTTSGIFRLLLSGTPTLNFLFLYRCQDCYNLDHLLFISELFLRLERNSHFLGIQWKRYFCHYFSRLYPCYVET